MSVEVFAKVTASVSHELKNVLAIVNENAGLLDDLIMMAGPDQGVPPERVKRATDTITRQISRANTIIKNINRFAHCGDTPMRQEPLKEMLELMISLTDRQAAMKNITSSVDCPTDLKLTAAMMPFTSLIYLSLRGLIDIAAKESELKISAQQTGQEIEITISGAYTAYKASDVFQDNDVQPVLEFLAGKLLLSGSKLQIHLPQQ